MKQYTVYLMPDAINDLNDIYDYIAGESGLPEVAWTYIGRLRAKCQGLEIAPIRGQKRDDLRKNIRITAIDKNAVIAFEVDEDNKNITVFNIFYGGQDYETIMRDNEKV